MVRVNKHALALSLRTTCSNSIQLANTRYSEVIRISILAYSVMRLKFLTSTNSKKGTTVLSSDQKDFSACNLVKRREIQLKYESTYALVYINYKFKGTFLQTLNLFDTKKISYYLIKLLSNYYTCMLPNMRPTAPKTVCQAKY